MHDHAAVSDLARALSERGLDSRWRVRVGAPQARLHTLLDVLAGKDLAVIRRLTTRKLREHLTNRALLVDGLALPRARELAAELQRAGAYTWIEHELSERYAFGPRTRARPCEWLLVHGRSLALMRGRPWDWEASELVVREGHTDVLLAAIDEARARWADEGLTEVGSEAALLNGISASSPRLEDQLREADADELPILATVYNDWLMHEGDARAEVGNAVLHRTAPSDRRAEFEALGRVGAQVMGALPPQLWRGLRWVGPLIIAARLPPASHLGPDDGPRPKPTALSPREQVETLLRLPAAKQLRSLELAHPFDEIIAELAIADTPAGSTLRRLALAYSPHLRLEGLPRIEQLSIATTRQATLVGAFPRLARLSLRLAHAPGPLARGLIELDAPRLRSLSLRVAPTLDTSRGLLVDQLRELLALPCFAGLAELELGLGGPDEPVESDLIHMLSALPCRATLERLDLRAVHLSTTARATLERARDRLPEVRAP